MKLPNQKLYQINSLLPGLEQFKSLLFSLSQNKNIDSEDRKKLKEYLDWLSEAPVNSFDYNWDSGKVKIVAEDSPEYGNKKEIKKQVKEIWQYVSEHVVEKYSKKEAFRASGHFIDQMLNLGKAVRYTKKKGEKEELVDFQVHKHDFTYIKLNPSEEKLMRAILILLHLNSNLNLESEDYYAGNGELLLAEEGYRLPHLKLRPIDLYKAYTGKESGVISGAEIQHIKKVVFNLEKQLFKVTYRRVIKKKEKGKEKEMVQLVSINKPLFKVISFLEITQEEEQLLEAGDESVRELKEELILALNPIFIDQVKTKYIEFPFDITKRVEEAAGGPKKVTQACNLLVDYLLREKSSKRFKCEIAYTHLLETLGLNRLLQRGEKSRAKKKAEKAIEVAEKIGLLEKIEFEPGSKKQEKVIFHINPEFL